jgi:tape measure domain-containing protein
MNAVQYVLQLVNNISAPLAQAQNSVNQFQQRIQSAQSSTSGLGGSLGKLGGLVAGAFSIYAIAGFGKQIVEAGANMEQTRVQFETFTGSAKKGNKVIAELQKFSLATPFDDEQVLKAGKSLLAFGVGTDELQEKLTQIGNISSATGKDFNELTTIYGKAKTAGTLYAEDINQLVEAGIPIIDEFAKQLGVPTSQVKKMASEGKISFGMLEKGFDNLGGASGKWGALMDKQSKTVAGRWSSLVGFAQNLASSLGEATLPFIGGLVDKGSEMLAWVKANKDKLGEMFSPLTNAIQPLFDSFKRIQESLGITGDAGGMLQTVMEYVGYAIQLISPVIEIAATALGKMYEAVAKVVKVFWSYLQTNKEAQTNLVTFYNVFKTVFGAIGEIAGKIFGGIATTIDGILNKDFSKIGKGLSDIVFSGSDVVFNKKTWDGLNDKAPDLKNYFATGPETAATEAQKAAEKGKGSKGAASAATGKGKELKTKVGEVTGSKPTSIHITIQKLIGVETQHNTTMKEAIRNAGEALKMELVAAVSDVSLLVSKN